MSAGKFRCPSHWTLRQRLEHYSIADPGSGCILWVGNTGKNGYGMLNWQNQPWLAHRLAWIEVHGRIPSGMNVLHRCDVRACINPAHLFLGTTADNMRDRREKERIRGRLPDGALAAIQSATGSPREIAARYGVPEGVVCKIKHEQLAAQLKLPRPPIRISKSDKLLATMEQLQSTLQEVLQALAERQIDGATQRAPRCGSASRRRPTRSRCRAATSARTRRRCSAGASAPAETAAREGLCAGSRPARSAKRTLR